MEQFTDRIIVDFFRRQLNKWLEPRERFRQLKDVKIKSFEDNSNHVIVQFNPARIVSTRADISKDVIKNRSCFLCKENRPAEQMEMSVLNKYTVLINPFPILPLHFTVPFIQHIPQNIREHYLDMMIIAEMLDDMFVFYNGPKCGASAPDHMHFQIGCKGIVPIERDWDQFYCKSLTKILSIDSLPDYEQIASESKGENIGIFMIEYICPIFVIIARNPYENYNLFKVLYGALPLNEQDSEPMMNILSWTSYSKSDVEKQIVSVIIPRKKHRPDAYYNQSDEQILVSPGALDMAGMIITPREIDFNTLDYNRVVEIISECGMTKHDVNYILDKLK